ncbi:MAG: glycerol kinase GlpK [Anaerolineaceae bacterium]|nr:glycerol kinase GlpK [Anaerolineaceae bacterium]
MTKIIALDQSTSATKALLFEHDGQLLDSVSLPHQQYYPQVGWVEHDAEEIYTNTRQVLGQLIQKHGLSASELLCLSITNQRETIVVFERESGKPLYHAIVWQCRRGDPLCQQFIKDGHESLVHQKTGLKIDTYFPASKLTWLLTEEPEIKQKLENGAALIGTIDAYLIYRLTNGQVFATDHSNASRTLLFNITSLQWDPDLCALFRVPIDALPEIRESSAVFGETDLAGVLSKPIPICGVMGDSQAALFAQRCFTPGDAKVTLGTGSSILLNIGDSLRYSQNGLLTAIGWVYGGKPTYAYEGIINYSAATITWLRDQLDLIESFEETEQLAHSVEDNGGVYLVPAFVGLNAPYWRSDIKAAILGLSPSSTKAHVVRAALESIAYQIKDVLELMSGDAGTALTMIRADGGAVRNQFLVQFIADLAGIVARASDIAELSALGAVFAGTLGIGIYSNLDELARIPATFVDYTPQMSEATADKLYAGWKSAVRQIL